MHKAVEAALRGGLADSIAVGLTVWAAYELGRASVTGKIKREAYAEGAMDAYKSKVYN